ncbi:MAG: hypothetical protein HY365_00500 [Candidatus Aenigmarchaeota archaeon]|nr:hypothetical protein [Candidatus Aenigmarchaeota archaeon]
MHVSASVTDFEDAYAVEAVPPANVPVMLTEPVGAVLSAGGEVVVVDEESHPDGKARVQVFGRVPPFPLHTTLLPVVSQALAYEHDDISMPSSTFVCTAPPEPQLSIVHALASSLIWELHPVLLQPDEPQAIEHE